MDNELSVFEVASGLHGARPWPERSRSVATGGYPGPIGRHSKCAANGARSLLTTITFLGERQAIFDPDAAMLI
jgi:hypothetical protein